MSLADIRRSIVEPRAARRPMLSASMQYGVKGLQLCFPLRASVLRDHPPSLCHDLWSSARPYPIVGKFVVSLCSVRAALGVEGGHAVPRLWRRVPGLHVPRFWRRAARHILLSMECLYACGRAASATARSSAVPSSRDSICAPTPQPFWHEVQRSPSRIGATRRDSRPTQHVGVAQIRQELHGSRQVSR